MGLAAVGKRFCERTRETSSAGKELTAVPPEATGFLSVTSAAGGVRSTVLQPWELENTPPAEEEKGVHGCLSG